MPLILESIVTTLSPDGHVNIAPMGPEMHGSRERPEMILRPFEGSRTYHNLLATSRAVIHVTDDAWLLARAAVGSVDPAGLGRFLADARYWRLDDCHRYFAVETVEVTLEPPKARLTCRVVESAVVRPHFGFNRAKHAVLEAAILATRIEWIAADEIAAEMHRLRPLIDKTGGEDEHVAFEFLQKFIDERLRPPS